MSLGGYRFARVVQRLSAPLQGTLWGHSSSGKDRVSGGGRATTGYTVGVSPVGNRTCYLYSLLTPGELIRDSSGSVSQSGSVIMGLRVSPFGMSCG